MTHAALASLTVSAAQVPFCEAIVAFEVFVASVHVDSN